MKQEIFNLIDDVIRSAKNVGYCTDYEGEVEEEESNLSGYERELRKKIEEIEEENASLTAELETVKRERLAKCKFEKDVYGFYLTPLLGYSNVGGQKSIWIGWLFWLFSIIWEEK